MSKIIDRVRLRDAEYRLSAQGVTLPSPTGNRIDLVLQRLASASQLGLLFLAIFGYFYTVVPVYQKSLLDEEIAKKTLELHSMEDRLSQTEALLASREAEFNVMTNQVNELKVAANDAHAGLRRAQGEVGKLRGTVESQYFELRPRLLGDFQSLALSQCKTKDSADRAFEKCVERKVLPSLSLAGLKLNDRVRLLRIVRAKGSAVDKAWEEYSVGIARRKQNVEAQAKEAQARCERSKGSEDYKDNMKKISIDYQCNIEVNRSTSDRMKIRIDEMFAGSKVLTPYISAIVEEFLADR